MLALLLSRLAEELFETGEGLVDVTGPGREREVDLRSLEFLADLFVLRKDKWIERGSIKRIVSELIRCATVVCVYVSERQTSKTKGR